MKLTVTENKLNVAENGVDQGTLICATAAMAMAAKTMLENGKEHYGFEYDGEFDSYVADMCDGEWVY